jgi:hypothetical protein
MPFGRSTAKSEIVFKHERVTMVDTRFFFFWSGLMTVATFRLERPLLFAFPALVVLARAYLRLNFDEEKSVLL